MIYYNEIDPYAAQWLRNLIAAGHIAQGVVDERSICDVDPADLAEFTQCHFFAGIGVWSLALRRAGWPDDRPVWTGSCPCQPFSAAGKRGGFDDERHLWPEFFRLIRERRPAIVFGEQVASKDGLEWLDAVQADLEGADYASAAVDICAAGVGAPHIRQRLYWVGHAEGNRPEVRRHLHGELPRQGFAEGRNVGSMADTADARLEGRLAVRQRTDECAAGPHGVADGLVDTSNERHERHPGDGREAQRWAEHAGDSGRMGYTFGAGRQPEPHVAGSNGTGVEQAGRVAKQLSEAGAHADRSGPTNGHWADADWLYCRDDKWRPVEPGTFPLAHGATARVGRLRAYGNAIVPQVAEAFIRAYMP